MKLTIPPSRWWKFLAVHAVWWTAWFSLNVEPFPYGLLTMILSLEAIVLSTLILIFQDAAAARDHAELEADRTRSKRSEKMLEHLQTLIDRSTP